MIASRDPEDRAWRALFAQAGAHSREARDYVTRAGETIAWGGTITYEVTVPTSAPRTLALHALSQIATRIEVRLEELVRWQQTALALGVQVLATEWQQRFADATTLWRVDGTRCRAVLSDDFTPIDTVPLMRSLEAEWRAMTLAPTRLDLAGDVQRLEFAARHGAGGTAITAPGSSSSIAKSAAARSRWRRPSSGGTERRRCSRSRSRSASDTRSPLPRRRSPHSAPPRPKPWQRRIKPSVGGTRCAWRW